LQTSLALDTSDAILCEHCAGSNTHVSESLSVAALLASIELPIMVAPTKRQHNRSGCPDLGSILHSRWSGPSTGRSCVPVVDFGKSIVKPEAEHMIEDPQGLMQEDAGDHDGDMHPREDIATGVGSADEQYDTRDVLENLFNNSLHSCEVAAPTLSHAPLSSSAWCAAVTKANEHSELIFLSRQKLSVSKSVASAAAPAQTCPNIGEAAISIPQAAS